MGSRSSSRRSSTRLAERKWRGYSRASLLCPWQSMLAGSAALSRQVPRRLPALRTPMRRPTRPCPTVASLPLSQQPEPRAWVGVTAGCGLCAGPAPRDPRAHQKQFATEGRTASAGESPGSGYDLVGTPGEHTGESVGAIGIFRRSCDNRGLRLARCKSAPGPACSSFKDSVECPLWPPRFRN